MVAIMQWLRRSDANSRSNTEATMRHVSIVGGPRSQPVVFQQYISISKNYCPTVDCFTTSKKSIIAKRVGPLRQITLIYTKQYCCCTKSNYL